MFLVLTSCLGAKSQDFQRHLPQEEEPPVLRDLGEVELQLRKTIPVVGQEIDWVRNLSCKFTLKVADLSNQYSKQDLELVAAPALQPAETVVDAALIQRYEEEMKAVSLEVNPHDVN